MTIVTVTNFCFFVAPTFWVTSFWNILCGAYMIRQVLSTGFNPLHPNISIDILHTLFYTFPLVLIRRICLTIKVSQVGDHFLNSHNLNEWFSSIAVRRNYVLITIRVLGVELVISVLACYLILNFKSCVEKIPFKYYFGHVHEVWFH